MIWNWHGEAGLGSLWRAATRGGEWFRVVQWNTLADGSDGNLPVIVSRSVLGIGIGRFSCLSRILYIKVRTSCCTLTLTDKAV